MGCLAAAKREISNDAKPPGVSRSPFDELRTAVCNFFVQFASLIVGFVLLEAISFATEIVR